jgi:N-acylneuraminate cytidylyltransferase/CMP-N,N'-diacetyllegionaminic acid synthase
MEPLKLCSICARSGSKGVPGKNLAQVAGKPLIVHSVEQAVSTGLFAAVAVSSDSQAILDAAAAAGATILVERPMELATDVAPKLPVIQHCLIEAERAAGRTFEIVVDLDSTSPLRLPGDIAEAVALLERTGADNVITAMPARRSPYFNLVEVDEDGFVHLSKTLEVPVTRRQESPRCFDMNASIYVWWRKSLLRGTSVFMDRTRLFEMPEERSIDIDTPLDLKIVELLFAQRSEPA